MKQKMIAAIAALLLVICCVSGCGEEPGAATPDEATADSATVDEAQTTAAPTQAGSSAVQTSTAPNNKNATAPTVDIQPTTAKPVQENIPPDTIGWGNINPGLSYIQDMVIAEMNMYAIRSITLDHAAVTLKVGESSQLALSFDPENAVPKTCTVKSSDKCVTASVSDGIVTVLGKSEGTAKVTVTSYNGAATSCTVTVKKDSAESGDNPAEITDDTVLPHAKVCTRENAERWRGAVDAYCSGCGIQKNEALSGDSVVVSTADYTEDGSFNSYNGLIVSDAAAQIDTFTGKNYSEYEYNCILVPEGAEFCISVTLVKKAE